MKIVHLCLGCFFPDNHSYQENLLPKYHKRLGHDVEVIASLVTFDKNGKITNLPKASAYINEHGIPVTRLDYLPHMTRIFRKLKCFVGLHDALESASPDIIFVHGCQFLDIRYVARYKQAHPNVRILVDNHADFANSATNWLSRTLLHRVVWRACAQLICPYTERFYGVLPARVDFLRDMYGVPADKIELLVMGADDEKVAAASKPDVRTSVRRRSNIADDDFLIITGGKIDMNKTQTLLLMEAVRGIPNEKVKLIVFGSIVPELKDNFNALCDGAKVQYLGWLDATETCNCFVAADLVVFPGHHSVFWEEVCGLGVPMLVKYWAGMTHVDLGGNVEFLYQDTVDEIRRKLQEIMRPERYVRMKQVAQEKGMHVFSYYRIAERSIRDASADVG